jgi:hypothetical protein
MLATLAEFKARYGVSDTRDDAMITAIIEEVSAEIAAAAGRVWGGTPCLERAELTQVFRLSGDGFRKRLWLAAAPITSITSVKQSLDQDWDDTDALTELDDYYRADNIGAIDHALAWTPGYWVRVEYTGGFTPAGSEALDGETAIPNDLRGACLQQAGFVWQRRNKLGLTGESAQGGSVSAYARDELLPGVRDVVARYRPRWSNR